MTNISSISFSSRFDFKARISINRLGRSRFNKSLLFKIFLIFAYLGIYFKSGQWPVLSCASVVADDDDEISFKVVSPYGSRLKLSL